MLRLFLQLRSDGRVELPRRRHCRQLSKIVRHREVVGLSQVRAEGRQDPIATKVGH